MYYTYVLEDKETESQYVGQTGYLKLRMMQHLDKEVRSTKRFNDIYCVLLEKYETRSEAMKREKYFKTYKGWRERKELIKKFESIKLDQLVESL